MHQLRVRITLFYLRVNKQYGQTGQRHVPPPPHPPGCVVSTGRTKIKSRYPLNKMMCQLFLMYPGIVRLVCRAVCCFDTVWAEID